MSDQPARASRYAVGFTRAPVVDPLATTTGTVDRSGGGSVVGGSVDGGSVVVVDVVVDVEVVELVVDVGVVELVVELVDEVLVVPAAELALVLSR